MMPLERRVRGGLGLLCYSVKGVTKGASAISSQRASTALFASCSNILGKLWGSSESTCTICPFVSAGLSYKWLHSLKRFLWEMFIANDFLRGLYVFCCFLGSFIYRQTPLGLLTVMARKLEIHKGLPCVSPLVCELATDCTGNRYVQ